MHPRLQFNANHYVTVKKEKKEKKKDLHLLFK